MSFSEILLNLEKEGNFRRLPDELPRGFLDFSSNDYLGIATNEALIREFLSETKDFKFSSTASRLLASGQNDYNELEELLENKFNRPALLFNSGYHANTGLIPALTSDVKTLVVADKLAHASIIDGVILSRADFRRFPHNDIQSLKKIIERNIDDYDRILIITESIFSMDGDEAPIEELLGLKRVFPKIMLYLDEAHAIGVRGKAGLGMAHTSSSPELWDIVVCPMGKAIASMGAFVICNEDTKDFLINRSRSFIFSTALPPIQIKWSKFVISKLPVLNKERKLLLELSELLSKVISYHFPGQLSFISHIQPAIIGDSHATVKLSQELMDRGIKGLPIRRPTVPAGTERIRFSLSASMTPEDILKLNDVLTSLNAKELYHK